MEMIDAADRDFPVSVNRHLKFFYTGLEPSICSTTPSVAVVSPLDGKFSSAMTIIITPEIYLQPQSEVLVSEKLRAILDCFGLNKSDLARILGVSRPAVYAWLAGQSEASEDNLRVIQDLYSMVEPSEQGSWFPIFHSYLERPIPPFKKSLIDMLADPQIDVKEVRGVVRTLRQMSQKRSEKLAESEAKSRVIHTSESQQRILDENLLGILSEE